MPNYIFHPRRVDFKHYVTVPGVFTPEECELIIREGDKVNEIDATVGGDEDVGVNPEIRISKLRWIECTWENAWIWHRIAENVIDVNNKFFQFDLLGFKESIQLTRYEEGMFYIEHMDYGKGPHCNRKLSLSIQLTDPATYEGGDLELNYGAQGFVTMQRDLGSITFFPSFTLHRVTPVTRGVRHSVVLWVTSQFSFR